MKSIIKHFEFKSSSDQLVTISGLKYKGKPVFFAVGLAESLGYTNPSKALKDHCKHLIKLNYNESLELGLGENPRGVILAGQSDMFRLVMRSHLPSAERFQDWVFESVLPSIMETGSYSIKQSQSGLPEYRRARTLKMSVDAVSSLFALMPNLSNEAKQCAAANIVNPIVGFEAVPLPVLEEKYYTAGEVGGMLEVSANKIGRIANEHNLKNKQHGKFFLDKSAHSDKQVEAFRYNENGIKALRHLIHGVEVA
ncbi:BRO-N domain-containing protein [Xenorhabdus bovienii]|uniref:Similar to bacteriophage protein n=1 Tax=Xenorhabdus bovienii str. kraussei Becker Underwood TaxID=1398204 RepID=A0A077Q0A5_XENBV|nr:BRO family protein [Xenorhabdus bovienii]CDH26416.1 Similar to bacteriophage protein [Xenorhabdus bovienii str. kraussei Becker Underwood]